ncbi:recombination-associated protein RdgC [Thorsellia kenyensis]|uniref:Recombination-associated protein RdgC n=1 Tax=Thorsellia kenyensis TaxID=1549888 RepID=A0ABV6C6U5_9GAMM
MWFTNLRVYQLKKDDTLVNEKLNEWLENDAFTPCQSQDIMKLGWIAPLENNSNHYVYEVGQQKLMVMRKEEKILPAQVINQQLKEKVQITEEAQDRKLTKAEKAALKEELLITLMPRAFSRYSNTWVWVDLKNQRVVVNTSSSKRAEEVLSLLRKSLGSLPVVPLVPETPLEKTMTRWLKEDELPHFLQFGQEAELRSDEAEGGVIRCKQQELQTEEILHHIDNGKSVMQISLSWREKVDFILTHEATIKRIKITDILKEQNSDIDKSDFAQRFDADFVLMSGELTQLLDDLYQSF